MKFLGYEIGFRKIGSPRVESRSYSYTSADFWKQFLGGKSLAGSVVSQRTILGVAPMWAAIRVISTALAGLEANVFRLDGERQFLAVEHPMYRFFKRRPHPNYTKFDFFAALLANAVLGNGYARIHWDEFTMRPTMLEILPSETVTVEIDSLGALWYRVTGEMAGKHVDLLLPDSDVLHIRGLSMNGVTGESVSIVHSDNLGAALSSQKYAAGYFGNGAHPSAVMTVRDPMTSADRLKMETNVSAKYSGIEKAGGVMVLDGTEAFHTVQNDPGTAMLIDFRHLTVDDVSRITGVPPHLLANLDRSTNNNIEYQSSEFVRYCLAPWAKKIEQEIESKLFREDEQGVIFYKYNFNSLLMADTDTEAAFARTAIQNSFMTPNEIRLRFGMNPLPGGDKLMIQLNMTTTDSLPDAEAVEDSESNPPSADKNAQR